MLEKVVNGFYIGIGFCIAVALAIILFRAWVNATDWDEEAKIFDPTDVAIVGHRDVRLTDKYTVSGVLRFDDRSRYEDVTILISVYQDGEFIMECWEYLFLDDNTDNFSVECDLEVQKVPQGVSYKVRVSQATLAYE